MQPAIQLIKVADGLYRSYSGNLSVAYRSWEPKDRLWTARWTDFFSTKWCVHGTSFADLNAKLQPYGFKLAK